MRTLGTALAPGFDSQTSFAGVYRRDSGRPPHQERPFQAGP